MLGTLHHCSYIFGRQPCVTGKGRLRPSDDQNWASPDRISRHHVWLKVPDHVQNANAHWCAAAKAGSAAPEATAWCSQQRQSPAGRVAPARGSARAARCRPAARQPGGSGSCGSWRVSPAGRRTCQTPALSTALSALCHLGKQTYVAFQSILEIALVWEGPHTARCRPAVR